jgi:hypothetical protein
MPYYFLWQRQWLPYHFLILWQHQRLPDHLRFRSR